MTQKDSALAEMTRVLKPGGRLLRLEFSKVAKPLEKAYDWYSFRCCLAGSMVAATASYKCPGRVDPHCIPIRLR